jgi:hypothetical protein
MPGILTSRSTQRFNSLGASGNDGPDLRVKPLAQSQGLFRNSAQPGIRFGFQRLTARVYFGDLFSVVNALLRLLYRLMLH